MNDIHGRGADGRDNTPSVADVGGAAGPREGADPTSGNDASGDASGARMGGSDPVDVAYAKVDPVMIRVVEFLREAQEFFRLATADERADAAASLVDEVVAWAEELRTATLDVAAHVNGIESLKDTVVANANQLQDDIRRAYKAAWEAGAPCPFCLQPTSRVPPFCEHVADVCPLRRTTVGGRSDALAEAGRDLVDAIAKPAGRDFASAWERACLLFGRFGQAPKKLVVHRMPGDAPSTSGTAPVKDLDPTGVCNWCGEECSNAFCRPECYRSYRDGEKQCIECGRWFFQFETTSDAGERQKP